ncbi:FadR/GntR family transcriptional regulator [Paracoccus sp. SCSIO 75233]|uniref:FadR/GntR family transcriptional regulator n=1 Tax=Paracoccus sp. SCSIO 75233 TaxID=3017782 RepID=UPI0022F1204B|nr:FCD domain-containing protein [Paracoccus sp. SCSIO 75233]WBU55338.1 FCD domain-containing protein [Paracoccus sp. SCSIO 75233]
MAKTEDFKDIPGYADTLVHRSVREVVADKLSGLIASGVLSVGDELPSERDLAQAWQVSRESVRGGLRILAEQGVLAVSQGARTRVVSDFLRDSEGTVVSSNRLNANDIHHINDARLVVELEVVSRAATRITQDALAFLDASLAAQRRSLSKPVEFLICDREFHFAIYEAAGNDVLTDIVKELYGYMMPNRVRVMGGTDAIATSIEDHAEILAALKVHDAAAAVACFETHIERIYRSTLASIDA